VEVTLPRFLFVREARYYFNNGRKNGGNRKTCTPNLSVPFRLANESGALVRFNFQKCPRSDSHRDWIGFEPIFSALEYAGESGAPGRIRTDTLPGLSRFSLRWNTGAKDPPSGRAPDYSRYHGMGRFPRFGGIKWLPEEGSHRHRQIQSLSSY
jgi:hypothetical protein